MCLSFRSLIDKEVASRKSYRCEWCAGKVTKGERSRYRSYVLDGEITSGHMHLECYDAMMQSRSDVICEGWMAGDFERGEIAA